MDDNHKININPIQIFIWKWWRGIDQHLLIAVIILMSLSLLLVTTASSAVAGRIGLAEDYFANRHLVYSSISIICLLIFSSLDIAWLKRIIIAAIVVNIFMLIFVKLFGHEVKGAKRWINLFGFSYQPSEFIKPLFAVTTGWIFSLSCSKNLSFLMSLALYLIVAFLLIIQPDLGMLIALTGIWSLQLFVAGIPILWMIIVVASAILGIFAAYNFLPHVHERINSFIHPSEHENYQVSKSLEAFWQGGIFGRGPGEGNVKHMLPDSHTDFIFAVAGEEFGILVCIFISTVFAFIVIKGIIKLIRETDKFIMYASVGIIAQIGLQSAINMGVSLNLLPTKGMTLPFISYGGSSSLSISIAMGILLSLTRSRKHIVEYNVTRSMI